MQQRGPARLDTWLTRLLIAIIRKQGNEVRISGFDLEDVPSRAILFTDYDSETHEVVLRHGSGAAEAIVINTEQQWATTQTPIAPSVPSPASSQGGAGGGAVPSDQDLARLEEKLLRRAAERQREKADAERRRAYQTQE